MHSALTGFATTPGFCVRIVLIVWNTSVICSALNRLILIINAQNVPERPIPSLNTYKYSQELMKYEIPCSCYLQWTVIGPLAVLRCTCSNISIRSTIDFGLLGQDLGDHSTYCSCVMVLSAF